VSDNAADVTKLKELVEGTKLAAAFVALTAAEAAQISAKAERDRRTKAIDRLMQG
jgi:hypothetical protein